MSNPDSQADLSGPIRTMQIIAAALSAGPAIFLAVVLSMRLFGERPVVGDTPMMTYVAVVAAVFAGGAAVVVPKMVVAGGRGKIARGEWQPPAEGDESGPATRQFIERTGDAGKLCMLYQTKLIIGMTLVEGATFFAIVACLIDGTMLALIVALLLIIGQGAQFPARSRVEHWIEDQLETLEQERRATA